MGRFVKDWDHKKSHLLTTNQHMKPAKLVTLFSSVLLIISSAAHAQMNQQLMDQLDSIVSVDQEYRSVYESGVYQNLDSVSRHQMDVALKAVDSLHYLKLQEWFDTYGFLDYDLVGEEGSYQFWLLVQHQDAYPDFQKAVLTQMKEAVDQGKASSTCLAFLTDRVCVNDGKLQIYGTQFMISSDSNLYVPRPVEDPQHLEARRASASLPPMNVYLKLVNQRFAPVAID